MKKIVVASMQPGAGKTSLITGIVRNLHGKFTYLKPFGDRMVYLKKRLWDHDAALMTKMFNIDRNPEDLSIGFEHSKLRYMYDEVGIQEKLREMVASGVENSSDIACSDGSSGITNDMANDITDDTNECGEKGKDEELVIIEGGKDLQYGSMVHLDPISIAKYLEAELLLVLSGDDTRIMDNLTYFAKRIDTKDTRFMGVIFNKVLDPEDFKETFLPDIEAMGVNVLGIIPNRAELGHLSLNFLSRNIFAKIIAGESGLNKPVKNIFVGAMSVNMAQRNPLFHKEGKLIITSGDRSDMILAALETESAGIILTNNIIPNSTIISKAAEKNIPLMVAPQDTYTMAMQINRMECLLSMEDTDKIVLLQKLVKEHIDCSKIFQ